MFSSNLISFVSQIVSWLEVWPNTQIKMKELPVVSVAPLSSPCKTVNTRSPVLVILGVYHVKILKLLHDYPCLVRKPHLEESQTACTASVLGCLWLSPSMLPRVTCHDFAFGVHATGF